MVKVLSRSVGLLCGLLLLLTLFSPGTASAQNANAQALGLVRDGMDAYSNLDLDAAKAKLDQALGISATS
jgi:hypothetical protein